MSESNQFRHGQSPPKTCGEYSTEKEACAAFDKVMEDSGLFKVLTEVQGTYIQVPHFKKYDGKPRIDRLLMPNKKLIEAGWKYGAIGVEIKKSGVKVGPPLSQLLDYMSAVWTGPHGIKVILDYCFLFAMEKTGHALGSIMAQNHIGAACLRYPPHSEYYRLQFFIGEQAILEYYPNSDRIEIKHNNLGFGRKTGSR
jgi:hypothetical protein